MQSITGAAAVINGSNVLFAAIIIVALMRSEYGAVVAIVSGAVYYAITNTLATLTLTGSLERIAIHHAEQTTTRRYHVLQYRQLAPPLPADVPQIVYNEPAPSTRFVPKHSQRTRAAALEWVWGLCDGRELDRSKVLGPHTKAPGQIQAPKPRQEVVDLLDDLRLVRVEPSGMLTWCSPYPTIAEVLDKIQGRGIQE